MSEFPRTWPVHVDGQDLLAVTAEDLEHLRAIRRQVGGKSARLSAMGARLRVTRGILDRIAAEHACTGDACAVCRELDRLPHPPERPEGGHGVGPDTPN
ncbi:hypothetical protein [Streptomyces sp. SID2888]|uniref:hypothetical protein n=1 Tax=Streptomyces sp. SID2888 TaxID=2690256 RepID=UPI00136F55DA|nr:hypothetical protein [Streptomyces sp. SID2888]MYV45149.1 hypothetical protein [Streptomyces sp. SID2888]